MDLKGKTVLFLGSSVTYGSASGGVSFADIMEKQCGIVSIKEAVSGTTLADIDDRSYVARLKNIDTNIKVDLFICQLSTNDARLKIDFDRIEAAICFILRYVKENFNCPIVFYTGTRYYNENYGRMVRLLENIQKQYDFHILNLWDDKDMLAVSKEDYSRYMSDPVHPTLIGYDEWWTPKFIDFCSSL